MAVVTPLSNFLGPEGDTVTVDKQLLNTEYCVLVHATQYIRYIHSPTQLKTIQTQLNKSLQSTFGCSGLPSTLQAELGIPPLQYYQMKQLTCSHFRLTKIHQHDLPGQIYAFRTHNLPHLDPIDLENRILQELQNRLHRLVPVKSTTPGTQL